MESQYKEGDIVVGRITNNLYEVNNHIQNMIAIKGELSSVGGHRCRDRHIHFSNVTLANSRDILRFRQAKAKEDNEYNKS